MRNKLFQQALDEVSEETRQKVRHYMNMVERIEESNDVNAIGFATWLNKPFKRPNGNGTNDVYSRCIPQHPEFTLYIMFDNEGNLDRKTFYTIQELYQIYLNESNRKTV